MLPLYAWVWFFVGGKPIDMGLAGPFETDVAAAAWRQRVLELLERNGPSYGIEHPGCSIADAARFSGGAFAPLPEGPPTPLEFLEKAVAARLMGVAK